MMSLLNMMITNLGTNGAYDATNHRIIMTTKVRV